ncbi:MAG: PQQ-dependent sugar dehydrogenase [Planctomycetota bacterium]
MKPSPCAFWIALFALLHPATAQSLPANLVNEYLVSLTTLPHDFCFLQDGRVLIAGRDGDITLYAGGAVVTQVGTVPNVEVGGERGMLSIERDPNFATNGYFYVWYSSAASTFTHLDRFTCTGDLGNGTSSNLTFATSSRRAILAAVPDVATNHNGGSARFGPDGMLYLTIGDDANQCDAQSTTSSLGCLLRMDVGALPAGGSATAPSFSTLDPGDNPLSNNLDVSQLVIANGLRNPFRMNIDEVTGNCYIGDVGQDEIEEFDEYVRPAAGPLPLRNFGWPWREGLNAFSGCGGAEPPSTPPLATFERLATGWRSIIAGPRYRNQNGPFDFGPGYEGVAFLFDFYTGDMRALVANGSSWQTLPPVAGQTGAWWASNIAWRTSMRQGPDGAIYHLMRVTSGPAPGGTLQRIRPAGPANSVVTVSGSGQRGTSGSVFAQPLIVQVRDVANQPLGGGLVNFEVAGGAILSTTNPVVADASGFAQTTVTATNAGGPVTVIATTPGSHAVALGSFFARKIEVDVAGNTTTLSILNRTAASSQQVPFIVMAGFAGVPTWNSPFGTVCTDPAHYLTVVIEDGTGIFGGVSLSGTGGLGTPTLNKSYTLPAGLLTGLQLKFTAIGFDGVDGIFALNCELEQY